jgi:hypothetical protein
VHAERVVPAHARGRHRAGAPAEPLGGNDPNLLGLRLGDRREAAAGALQQDLERETRSVLDVTGPIVTAPAPRRSTARLAAS